MPVSAFMAPFGPETPLPRAAVLCLSHASWLGRRLAVRQVPRWDTSDPGPCSHGSVSLLPSSFSARGSWNEIQFSFGWLSCFSWISVNSNLREAVSLDWPSTPDQSRPIQNDVTHANYLGIKLKRKETWKSPNKKSAQLVSVAASQPEYEILHLFRLTRIVTSTFNPPPFGLFIVCFSSPWASYAYSHSNLSWAPS